MTRKLVILALFMLPILYLLSLRSGALELYPDWPSLNEETKGKKRSEGRRAVIVRMPVLSRPFLINIAFALEFIRPHLVFAASRRLKVIVSAVSIRGNTVYSKVTYEHLGETREFVGLKFMSL